MPKLNKADSNRGGALLSVIIVMTVVGILGALVLSISYTNFRMKQIDKKSKDNFYSAEAVLDEISIGLQKEISCQYKDAYTTVMENYGSYSSSADMSKDFNSEFVLNMVDALKAGNDRTHYDFTKITGYVSSLNYPEGTYAVTSIGAGNVLDTLTDGLCIRNLCVTYRANNGAYINTITTDIKITTPVVEFARISTMPEIADYIMIAQEGLQVGAANSAFWSLQGKAFAGVKKEFDTAAGKWKILDPKGIELSTGSIFDANNADATLLVTEGDILLNGSASFNTGATTSLWANSVTASYISSSNNNPQKIASNTISLLGRSYIKDDTTVSGKKNSLILGGQYYGYSNYDTDASKSSAIIVNGSETTLNMSALKTLVVAGTSFVKTPVAANNPFVEGTATPANILMGDSVAVKSNQIAYMVPTECKGIASNPMTYTQYTAMLDEARVNGNDWEADALETVLSTLGRSLASYGGVSIQPIYSNRDGGSVYLYLNFTDADVASKYFMDYYGKNAAKLESYLKSYVKSITFNTAGMNRLVTQGNYLVPKAEAGIGYADNTGDVATTAQELSNYLSSYEALCAKLVENKSSLDPAELKRTVYQNLIDQNGTAATQGTGKLDKFLTACANNTGASAAWSDNIVYDGTKKIATIWANAEDKQSANSSSKVRCIIVDNKGGAAYTVPKGSGIIIATGDVSLTASSTETEAVWNGLIISNGKVLLNGGSSTNKGVLRADGSATAKAMQYTCSVGAAMADATDAQKYSVMNFFIGGGEFSRGDSSDAVGAKVDVRNCLSYENWKSE